MKIQAKQATMTFVSKETEKYQLEATAQYEVGSGKLTTIQGGMVRAEQRMVASFNRYSEDSFGFNFNGATVAEQQEILTAIHSFIESIEADLNTNI